MDRRIDKGQATRRQIVENATGLFTEQGYDAVSIEALLAACAISRGALYHHFPGKEAVFVAVLEATEERIVARLAEASVGTDDAVEALRRGCDAWLDMAATDPVVRRVVLNDAPGVIGWQAWRALDERYTLGLIRAALAAAARQGRLPGERVEMAAHILLAVLVEVALLIAAAPTDAAVRASGRDAVHRVLDGL